MKIKIENEWNKCIDSFSGNRVSAKNLSMFLFPCWQDDDKTKISVEKKSVQGVFCSEPTDYWSRFFFECIVDEKYQDQELLSGIKEWNDVPDGEHFRGKTLQSALCDSLELSLKLSHFSSLMGIRDCYIDIDTIRNIVTKTFRYAIDKHKSEASDKTINGFHPLFECAINNNFKHESCLEWVKKEILSTMPISINLACCIYNSWCKTFEINNDPNITKINESMGCYAKELFQDKPDRFIKAINPEYKELTLEFSKTLFAYKEQGIEFEKLTWFSKLLIDACKRQPQVMVPQIVNLFYFNKSHGLYGEEWIKLIFEDNLHDVMNILSKEINLIGFSQEDNSKIDEVKKHALDFIENRHSE